MSSLHSCTGEFPSFFTDRWFHSAVSKTLITWLKIWTRASAKMKPAATKSSTGGKWKTVPVHFLRHRLQQIWWQCRSKIFYAEEFDRCKCFRVSKTWLELTNYDTYSQSRTVMNCTGCVHGSATPVHSHVAAERTNETKRRFTLPPKQLSYPESMATSCTSVTSKPETNKFKSPLDVFLDEKRKEVD